MRRTAWSDRVQPLIIGASIYVIMRFLVPHSLDEEMRSLVGAGVAFVVALIVLGFGGTQRA